MNGLPPHICFLFLWQQIAFVQYLKTEVNYQELIVNNKEYKAVQKHLGYW